MLRTGIEQFVGIWVSESGYRLRIRKVRKNQAFADFLDPRGAPIAHTYMGGAPSMKMLAHYDDYNEDFRVDLREEGKGFILHLDHEYDYVLDSEQREALEPAISRYETSDQSIRAGPFSGCVLLIVWPSGSLCSYNRTTAAGNLTGAPFLVRWKSLVQVRINGITSEVRFDSRNFTD
jgi:hypothetical protein